MIQIVQILVIVLEGIALFTYLNEGRLTRRQSILFIPIYFAASLLVQGYPSLGISFEMFYALIIIFSARTFFRKLPLNASIYGFSFITVRHMAYIVSYFIILCICGETGTVLNGNLTMQGIISAVAALFETGIVLFIKRYFQDFLGTKDEKAGVCFFLGSLMLWALFFALENRLMGLPVPLPQRSGISYIVLGFISMGAYWLGYRFHGKGKIAEMEVSGHETSILTKYNRNDVVMGKDVKSQAGLDGTLEEIFREKMLQCQELGIQLLTDGNFSFLIQIGKKDAVLLLEGILEYALNVCKESEKEERKISVTGYDSITRIETECPCDMNFLKNQNAFAKQDVTFRTIANVAQRHNGWVKQQNKRGKLILSIKLNQ